MPTDLGDAGATDMQPDAESRIPLVFDDFERALPDSWGTAPIGGDWNIYNPSGAAISVAGGVGTISGIPDQAYADISTQPAARDVVVEATIDFAALPGDGLYSVRLAARVHAVTTSYYALRVRVGMTGAADADIYRVVNAGADMPLVSTPTVFTSLSTPFVMSLRVVGNPAQLCARVWRLSMDAEPSTCTLTTSDATPELIGPGSSLVAIFGASTTTSATMFVDDFGYYRVGPQ